MLGFDGSTRVTVEAADCSAALRSACDIDLDAPAYCTVAHLGTCWPGDGDDRWACECDGGSELIGATAAACLSALSDVCAERCEGDFGGCTESGPGDYRCLCKGTEGPIPPDPEPPALTPEGQIMGSAAPAARAPMTCQAALQTYCGERCESAAGDCEAGADSFACTCSTTGGGTPTFDELGGISPSACANALQRTCGEVLIAPSARCDDFSADAWCEAPARVWRPDEPRPETFAFRCQCGDGMPVREVDASACYRALSELCPEPIDERERIAPASDGELGSSCDGAGDCHLGVCHFGRTHHEGVCSAPCATDADCPSNTMCAFIGKGEGRCFVTCEGFAACELLNGAFDDPLYCADRVDVDNANLSRDDESGRICVPLSDRFSQIPVFVP